MENLMNQQNIKQIHVADVKRGRTSVSESQLDLIYLWLDERVARVFEANRVAQ